MLSPQKLLRHYIILSQSITLAHKATPDSGREPSFEQEAYLQIVARSAFVSHCGQPIIVLVSESKPCTKSTVMIQYGSKRDMSQVCDQ